ncbi:MAG: hypothetical protein Aurels2KO_43390 [Aureliella sp.]
MKQLRILHAALLLLFLSSSASADPITIDFTQFLTKTTTSRVIDLGDGLTLTIDNPTGLANFNRFHIINVGLRIDGGLSPHIDLTFSKDVQLNSYTLGEVTGVKANDTFTLAQGATTSSSQPLTTSLGSHAFSNSGATFAANTAINWTTASPKAVGSYALSGLTVTAVPEPATGFLLAAFTSAACCIRRRQYA